MDYKKLQDICRLKMDTIWRGRRRLAKMWVLGHLGRPLSRNTSMEDLEILNKLLDYKLRGEKCPFHAKRKKRRDIALGSNWVEKSRKIRTESNRICVGCKKVFEVDKLTVDHIIPVFEGGSSEQNNLQVMCAPCHKKKTKQNRESPRAFQKFLKERMPTDVKEIKKTPL